MYENIALLAIIVLVYSAVAGGLERTPVNGAVVFTAVGVALGPLGLGLLELSMGRKGIKTIAELTLAVVLFSDAANANLGVLRTSIKLPQRMLLVGLPLTIALGYGAGVMLFDGLGLLEIAILATMLAPTDAALGKAVVTNEAVPKHIRESLNAESGLNDGICVPILFVFIALAASGGEGESPHRLAMFLLAEEIGIGAAVGIGFALFGSWLVRWCLRQGWETETWRQLPVVAMAIGCFAGAQALGGSGFIAAFVGGILYGWLDKKHKHTLLVAAEGTGDMLALLTWVAFGAIVVGNYIDRITGPILLYSILSITVIRMLPVFLVLTGTGMRTDEKLFVGWFGPRGLASVVFGVIVLNENLPGGATLAETVVCTVTLSILAHGVSANPLVAVLAAREARTSGQEARG